ncbi:MAG: Rdx family protein [Thermoleophilia bacterium]|nr:Rdx family protein [Thermoleophilia bacterium]MDH5332731.1 Rdx family protein [Thermoleophilia bacterium]
MATVGGHGQFDVLADADLLFSRHEAGRFPEPGEVARLLSTHGV